MSLNRLTIGCSPAVVMPGNERGLRERLPDCYGAWRRGVCGHEGYQGMVDGGSASAAWCGMRLAASCIKGHDYWHAR
jgi:hypothetical protein